MKKVQITAELLAPVAIKRDRQSERSESVRSVAGTLVRGALAALYLQQHGEVDETFRTLFLDETACRFGPLDPGPAHFPLTAASCKRAGITHALVDQLWYRIAQHHRAGSVPEDTEWRQCGACEADLKEHAGFWTEEKNQLREKQSARHHVAAHVGIDRHTNTAAESIFYTLEALLPSDRKEDLHGWITADTDTLEELKKLLDAADYRISVGHHRTRGYGAMRLELSEPIDSEDSEARTAGWKQWNCDLIHFLSSPPFSVTGLNPEEQFYFSLSFPTGAVLVDRFLRYTIDPADMIRFVPVMPPVETAFPMENRQTQPLASGGTVRWVTAITKHERLRGWNAAHGLPRQDEWMVARGSVYVYCFKGTTDEREALIEQLVDLSNKGIGLRRNEGFGTVFVSDDFHRRFCRQQEGVS